MGACLECIFKIRPLTKAEKNMATRRADFHILVVP
jgi:hypothetical protein